MIYPKAVTFSDGETLFREGDPGDCAYYIEEGTIDLISEFSGREALLGSLKDGDLIGEMAALDKQTRSATARVRGYAKTIQLHTDLIAERLNNADPLIALLLKAILQRFRDMRSRLHMVADRDQLHILQYAGQHSHSENYATESELVGQAIKDELRLQAALDDQELELFAQPVVSLPERKLLGAEGLLRWRHPQRGILGPGYVIAKAEHCGLIVDIGYMLIRRGCNILTSFDKLFTAANLPNILHFMSINVSPRQLKEPDFTARVHNILDETKVDPQRIKLEITESAMLEQPKLAEERLKSLKAVGVRIALDDFGTGYSSLSTVMDYPIDTIKIDQSFVNRMEKDRRAFNIIKTILAMANNMGFDVIVEGIEQEIQADMLTDLGCTAAQGYLFAKPLPIGELVAYAGLPCGTL